MHVPALESIRVVVNVPIEATEMIMSFVNNEPQNGVKRIAHKSSICPRRLSHPFANVPHGYFFYSYWKVVTSQVAILQAMHQ